MNKTLYCAISSHGFGHVAQSAPVLNRLYELRTDITIVIQCDAGREWLQQRLHFPFEHVQHDTDFGMLMKDAFTIDAQASHQRYCEIHQQWPDRVAETAQLLKQYQPALVYSNIAYLANAAAAMLSVPVVNLCSLSWYHIYRSYCATLPGAQQVLDDMLQAYNYAEVFLAPEPSMPMTEIAHVKAIGTIAKIGQDRGNEIREQYQLSAQTKLVLVSHGGVSMSLNFNDWPYSPETCYLVSQHDRPERPDFIAYESLSMPFIDVFCSCDTIVCKSGYGIYTEAACNDVSLLYTRRPDWPEDIGLVEWLQQHARCSELSLDELLRGDLQEPLHQLANIPRPPVVEPVGIDQAVETLLQYL
jgi:UDP:flavonoid glycosyltransferase YjiC (YdhE family)